MKVYLDDAPFPPSADTLAAADGCTSIYSRPWPADYADATPGVLELPDPPPPLPPPRVQIPKSVVMSRVNTAGMFAAVNAVFAQQPFLMFQWLSPDWPNVYADDPGLLQVLGAVGCTADQVAAITAPA